MVDKNSLMASEKDKFFFDLKSKSPLFELGFSEDRLFYDDSTKRLERRGAYFKEGANLEAIKREQDKQKALQGAITYLATEKLGDAILDVLDSPMGSVNDHEGVVIRDDKISPRPFKITGKFITGGVSSDFQKK